MEGLRFLKFSATWCQPCKMQAKIVDDVKEDFPDVSFEEIDIDDRREMAEQYGVSSVPTLILLKDNMEVRRNVGAIPKQKVIEFIKG